MLVSVPVGNYLKHPLVRSESGVLRNAGRVEHTYRTTAKPARMYSYTNASTGGETLDCHFISHQRASPMWNEMRSGPTSLNPARTEYASYWRWLAALGVTSTTIGIVIGAVWPGPLTGVLFPIGITILLIVAYGARARGFAAPNAR